MKNRTVRSAIYNQLGKNKVIRHIKAMEKHNGKNAYPVIVRYRCNSADFIGIETSEKTYYAIKNILGFYKIVR